ncbi:anti-sigma factor [Actinoplanes sp. CA-030573]|uniref:anti-sigma factor n=1 Tax=Actinoplanes sp. CA-030573 TaxID=3239898 RepID=UPI003D8E606D
MTPDVHALIGAYVLDAVDDLERAAFEGHLRECDVCRTEVHELRGAAARLADSAWSVPPPRLRETVLTAISNTRQLPPPGAAADPGRPVRLRPQRRRWLAAAAAVLVSAAGAGAAVYTVQEDRVRQAHTLADAAQAGQARIEAILAAPDLVVRQERLHSGGRVTVATSQRNNAGVIMLAADGAPAAGRVYQLWTIRSGNPASAGALAAGQTTTVRVVDGLPGSSAVGVTVEPAPGSTSPTAPLDALVKLA